MEVDSSPFVYDVFLNFSGTDTRRSFTDHLYHALEKKGVKTFRDEYSLEAGERIEKIFEEISKSKIFIPIFSESYAKSWWCLEEIKHIVQCVRPILPVFYHVQPTDVRKQQGSFCIEILNRQRDNEEDTVSDWKKSLAIACGYVGFVVNNCNNCGYESQVVGRIVERVLHLLTNDNTKEVDELKVISFVKSVLTKLDDKDSEQETERKIIMLVKNHLSQSVTEDSSDQRTLALQRAVGPIKKIIEGITKKEIDKEGEENINSVLKKVSCKEEENMLVNLIRNVRQQMRKTSKEEAEAKLILVVRTEMNQSPSEKTFESIKQKLAILMLRVVNEVTHTANEVMDSAKEVREAIDELALMVFQESCSAFHVIVMEVNEAVTEVVNEVTHTTNEVMDSTKEVYKAIDELAGKVFQETSSAFHVIGKEVNEAVTEVVNEVTHTTNEVVDSAKEVDKAFDELAGMVLQESSSAFHVIEKEVKQGVKEAEAFAQSFAPLFDESDEETDQEKEKLIEGPSNVMQSVKNFLSFSWDSDDE